MRIGINVPNELIQRVKQANPKVNLSQICRTSLEEYATKSERAQEYAFANHEEMEEVAIRLIETDERPLVAPDWIGYGLQDARDWVRTVDIHEWERFFDIYDFLFRRDGEDANSHADLAGRANGVKRFADRWDDHRELFHMLMDRDIDVPQLEFRKAYHDAWMSYALEARRLYLEHINAERERLTVQRREERNEIRVDPPSQLLEQLSC